MSTEPGAGHIAEVVANPFLFKGQTIAIKAVFSRMISDNEAVFGQIGGNQFIVVANVPATKYAINNLVLLGVKVKGMRQLRPPLGDANVADLEYSNGYFCQQSDCMDIPE